MAKILDGPEVTTLVQLIASGRDGWGTAFAELRKASGLSQKTIATALNLNDATVSHWERNKHRPTSEMLRKALMLMRVDARLLDQYLPGPIVAANGAELDTNPKTLAVKLAEKILQLADADPDVIQDAIHETLDMAVLASQGLKGLTDPRSAALFLDRADKRRQARRRVNGTTELNTSAVQFLRPRADESAPPAQPIAQESAPVEDDSKHQTKPRHIEADRPISEKEYLSKGEDWKPGGEPFVNDGDETASSSTIRRNGQVLHRIGSISF